MNATYTVMNKVETLLSAATATAASAMALGAVVLAFHVASVNSASDTDFAKATTPATVAKVVDAGRKA